MGASRVIAAADAATIKSMYERFEFKQGLKDIEGANENPPDVAGEMAEGAAPAPAGRCGAGFDLPSASWAVPAPTPPAEIHYEMVFDEAALARWLDAIDRAEVTAFDTETSSLDNIESRIVGISLAVAPGRAAYIPLDH